MVSTASLPASVHAHPLHLSSHLSEKEIDLKSSWSHRAGVASGFITVLISLSKSVAAAATPSIWLQIIFSGLAAYLLADLGSGVYHWAIDNYGNTSTSFFGSQIQAFQGHHKHPSTEAKRQFANNLHVPASAVTLSVLPINLACKNHPLVLAYVGVFGACAIFCQQFHAWAHCNKNTLHPIVVALQDAGILISPAQHATHHHPPYNKYYCIVSGIWNKFLEEYKVFKSLEITLYFMFGLKPRSWA